MSKKEEVLLKYKELLELIYEYCQKEEAFTSKHITRAFKTNDRIIFMMQKEGIISKVSNGRKKVFKWNLSTPPTESIIYEFHKAVIEDRREWLLKKELKKIDRNQKTLVFFEDNKPKQRRKISILWGLITF